MTNRRNDERDGEPSFPACSLHEADDADMGYASENELTTFPNQLWVVPSATIGTFYGKAMAIVDLGERIVFLIRGQGWAVRKLREILPRVRDAQLHADLTRMLRSHEINIALAGTVAAHARYGSAGSHASSRRSGA
jgi:hypothetical protein